MRACLTMIVMTPVLAQDYATRSGIKPWVDPDTPKNKQFFTTSRGQKWELTMSDEFNAPGRSFKPGNDHIWTSIQKPDGVNAALQVYAHNMTTTECDKDGTCYFVIITDEANIKLTTWNTFQKPPGFQTKAFHYQSGMVQSWNKFCYQGGMLELRAILPGAVSKNSGNPDLAGGDSSRVKNKRFYPLWCGAWLLGNLGRAIFSASTNRMWPYSYDECNEKVLNGSYQRISACNSKPGYGLNPNQGRGAPEIDLFEGAGTDVSSSIQIAPGMPVDFRRFDEDNGCVYDQQCPRGVNNVGVPASMYKVRGHPSWYQGLRYGSNDYCAPDPKLKQSLSTIKGKLQGGIEADKCDPSICPASLDVYGDLGKKDDGSNENWGINDKGTCFATQNPYAGTFCCNPGNRFERCPQQGLDEYPGDFKYKYQMDAISANWHLHVGAYTKYHIYQVEWVMGKAGYVRWMLAGKPFYEIPAKTLTDPPQNAAKTNPRKIMVEEPLYIIFNVALSSTWGTKPPNPGKPCRGNGTDPVAIRVCNDFPMRMKIDYVRLYQDTSKNSSMTITCDPPTHPTKKWIEGHPKEYEDADNKMVTVSGKAYCEKDDDCSVAQDISKVRTGVCEKKRCKCVTGSWTGPRCSSVQSMSGDNLTIDTKNSFGPPFLVGLFLTILIGGATFGSVYYSFITAKRMEESMKKRNDAKVSTDQPAMVKGDRTGYGNAR